MITVRRGTMEDAECLARLGRRLFEETFAAQNDPADMAAYLAQAFGASKQREELADDRVAVWLAECDGDAVGYAQCIVGGPTPLSVPVPPEVMPAELQRFYVDRRWHGHGVAPQLMAAVLSHAGAVRAGIVWLGVWEHNPRALRYYANEGFTPCGTQRFHLGMDTQTDQLLLRKIP